MADSQPTVGTCEPFEGRPVKYQADAAHRMWVETGRQPSSWAWVETTCGTLCLNVDHMTMQAPRRLAYPSRVCIYCGRSAGTQDHLLPRQWSGETKRAYERRLPHPHSPDHRTDRSIIMSKISKLQSDLAAKTHDPFEVGDVIRWKAGPDGRYAYVAIRSTAAWYTTASPANYVGWCIGYDELVEALLRSNVVEIEVAATWVGVEADDATERDD